MAKVYLDGLLVAQTAAHRAVIDLYLEEHIRLTREEQGCLKFEVYEDPNKPNTFIVSEEFVSEEAFAHHQERAKTSEWGTHSDKLERKFSKRIES
ncbi:MAG: antibiotic biosynthesis monooxygenase [Rhodobacteraceae bacterium]|nr:antibiotic biosynthesis monooxygenase [Paracoccaceae bacterium]